MSLSELIEYTRGLWTQLCEQKTSSESNSTCYHLYEEDADREKRYVQEIIYKPGVYLPLDFKSKHVTEVIHESFVELLMTISKDTESMNEAWTSNELWLQELAAIAYIVYSVN